MKGDIILKPYFLTEKIAGDSIAYVLNIIADLFDKKELKHLDFHMVILVPSMKVDRLDYPNYLVEPSILYEFSSGDKNKWEHKFDEIAQCKALQLWHGRNDGRTDCIPHLLFPEDTPWWGGVKRQGIVVACSGFQPHFDKMFSGLVADMCIGKAYNEWANLQSNLEGDFLS